MAKRQLTPEERDRISDLGQAFARWLAERPRIAKFPRLARLLYFLGGGK